MSAAHFLLAAALVSGSGVAEAVAQEREGERVAAPAAGTIRGRVTAADTGRPLRRARVIVRAAEGTSTGVRPIFTSTKGTGEFEAKDVPVGSYYVSAERSGYLTLQHGQRRPLERGFAVEVGGGQTTTGIDISLPRAGILAGRITDERGEWYPGVRVEALAMRYMGGRRQPWPVGGVITDDLGHFRISGLEPGTYYVVATSAETWRGEKKETYGYAATYYPGVAVDAAQTIALGPAEERMDVSFSLQPGRTARISGRLQTEDGVGVPGVGVQVAYSYGGSLVSARVRSVGTAGDGSFVIAEVPPGTYNLVSGGADETITVAGADIDNVMLIRKSGSTVSGTLVTDGGTPPPFSASGVRVWLEAPYDAKVLPTVRLVQVANDWSFKLTSVGGPFTFRLTGIPAGWTLASVQLGEKEITDVPWDVPTGGKDFSGMKIVVTQKIGLIAGLVVDRDGKPTSEATIVLFSEDPDRWIANSRFVRAARPSGDGRFSFSGLPPGAYLAVARTYVENGQWTDRTFLESIRDEATRLELAEGETRTITLRLQSPK